MQPMRTPAAGMLAAFTERAPPRGAGRGEKPASAAFLLETASRLYGPRTPNGRKAAADADRIWQEILSSHGSHG